MRILLFVLLIVEGTSFVFGKTAQKIVLDNWWTIDYVKNGCQLQEQEFKRGNPYAKLCPKDRSAEEVVREFEDELGIAFASENACHDVELIRFTPNMAKAAVKNPRAPATGTMAETAAAQWSLMFDLDGRSHTQVGQGWSLVGPEQQAFNGRISNTQRLVQQVCKIVKGMGGKMK